jgi:hypothetical protein
MLICGVVVTLNRCTSPDIRVTRSKCGNTNHCRNRTGESRVRELVHHTFLARNTSWWGQPSSCNIVFKRQIHYANSYEHVPVQVLESRYNVYSNNGTLYFCVSFFLMLDIVLGRQNLAQNYHMTATLYAAAMHHDNNCR